MRRLVRGAPILAVMAGAMLCLPLTGCGRGLNYEVINPCNQEVYLRYPSDSGDFAGTSPLSIPARGSGTYREFGKRHNIWVGPAGGTYVPLPLPRPRAKRLVVPLRVCARHGPDTETVVVASGDTGNSTSRGE